MTQKPKEDRKRVLGGLDLGGTKIQAVVLDEHGTVLSQARRATPQEGGPPAIVEALAAALEEVTKPLQLESSELTGVGVGAPGAVNAATGTLLQAGNLPGWSGPYPLAEALAKKISVPVYLGNDVQVAVAAEARLGAGRPYRSLLGVWWGTGVGGGIILDGQRWMGRGAAGEIGHTVVRRGGARCSCGRRGCLEAYAGRGAMERKARKALERGEKTRLFDWMTEQGKDRLTSGVWLKALKQGDPLAVKLIERALRMLGAGIASAVNLLDVEAVVIGGGLGTRLGQLYVERLRVAMKPHLFVPQRPPDLHLAGLGELSGAIGAALLAEPVAEILAPSTEP
ncbi:ROK family protein [Stigmatella sp. ncwal1]|uniref:ROK family protein n=1 Tax=Stigmatella ashevillensis TaxID=2995309 RepID=A0ABT5DIR2_9BACT|nr:ROK family protein [Stigmatella ashevillena]MDC0712231.1 ROK family protein [Stigmatella ashevillena]